MSIQIKDGGASGRLALVNSQNRLLSAVDMVSEESFYSFELSSAYLFSLPTTTLGSTSTYNLLYLKNTSSTHGAFIQKIDVSWNGGSTNFNRVVNIRFKLDPSAPTANNTSITPINLQRGSPNEITGTFQRWDGNDTGITSSTSYDFEYSVAQGHTPLDFGGALILGTNKSLLIAAKPEEAGSLSIIVRMYEKEIV